MAKAKDGPIAKLILVVDDDEHVRRVVVAMLKIHGFETLEAIDGVEALEIFMVVKDDLTAIITDFLMPKMNGEALITAISAIKHDMPIVLMSGYGEKSVEDIPNISFLQKPFSTAQLMEKLNQARQR